MSKQLPGRDSLAYDEDGQVYCWMEDARTGQGGHYPMVFKGYGADRKSVKYACPARAKGFACG